MLTAPIGHRVRARRKDLHLTQSVLADRVGVSTSYINLIEHDRRPIAGDLLKRLAAALNLPVGELNGAAERGLLQDLNELAADPSVAEFDLDERSARDLVARHGPWARALAALMRNARRDRELVMALSDRLNQDPLLNDAVHQMLSAAAAIRSVADIYIEEEGSLPAAQRARFDAILAEEAGRLAEVTSTLSSYFETTATPAQAGDPTQEVDDFLYERSNHFPDLEDAADDLRQRLGTANAPDPAALLDRLERKHRVSIETRPWEAMPGGHRNWSAFDPQTRTLAVLEGAPVASRRFDLAATLARLECQDALSAAIGEDATLASPESRARAHRALGGYLAAALVMPYDPFFEATGAMRYDIDALSLRFTVSAEQLCHRLTTLKRPGAEGVPFGFLRTNAAGYLTKRFPLPRFPIPRFGGACPLWTVYAAMQTPDVRLRDVAETPNGDRFLLIARSNRPTTIAYGRTRPAFALMLACDAVHADKLVYGDGLDISGARSTIRIGPTCVLCPRADCAHRQEAASRPAQPR